MRSGGARGYVHIGVIEVLLKEDYEIKSISDSSIGAFVVALYASGKLEEFKSWVLSLEFFDLFKLVNFSFEKSGMIKREKSLISLRR